MPYVTSSKSIDDMPIFPGVLGSFSPGVSQYVHESVRHFYVGNPDFTISETGPGGGASANALELAQTGLTKGGAALTAEEAKAVLSSTGIADGLVGVVPTMPGTFDYYIDDVNGNDSNEGTFTSPWASLSKINTAIASTQTRSVLVRNGTYDKAEDYVNIYLAGASEDTRLDIWFEPGCVMDGSAVADTVNGFEFGGGSWTSVIYGNGLKLKNYADISAGTSPNGVGNRGTQRAYILDVHVTGCDDGFSAHDQSTMICYRCSGVNGEKSAFVNVGTAYAEFHDCEFAITGVVNGSQGTTKFYGTKLIPTADSVQLTFAGDTYFYNCQIGTLTRRVQIVNSTAGKNIVINDSFLNAYIDGNTFAELLRCYGKLTTRQRNADGTGISIDRCVFVGPASGTSIPASTVHGANADFSGTIAQVRITNTVLKGFTTAIGGDMNLTRAQKFVSGNSYAINNCFNSNSTNIDADLNTAGASITGSLIADPLLRSAVGYRQTDYAISDSSPCVGAGVNGANIGFTLADIA